MICSYGWDTWCVAISQQCCRCPDCLCNSPKLKARTARTWSTVYSKSITLDCKKLFKSCNRYKFSSLFLYVTLLSHFFSLHHSAKSCQWDFSCSFNLAVVDLDDASTPSWLKRRKMESFLATDNQLTRAFVNSTKTRSDDDVAAAQVVPPHLLKVNQAPRSQFP